MPNYPSSVNRYPGMSGMVDHPGSTGRVDHPSAITSHGGFPSVIQFNTLVTSVTCLQAVQSDVGITLNGSTVSAWTDQSGNGKNYTGVGTAQPTYNAAALNGFATLTFDGVNDTLTSALSLPAPGTTPTFLWMIVKQRAWGAGRRLVGDSASGLTHVLYQNAVTPQITQFDSANGPVNAGGAIGSWVRVEAWFNNATTDYLKVGATRLTGTNTGNNASTGNRLIASAAGASFSNIEVAALMYFSGLPSAGELAALSAAVTAKYGASVGV